MSSIIIVLDIYMKELLQCPSQGETWPDDKLQ